MKEKHWCYLWKIQRYILLPKQVQPKARNSLKKQIQKLPKIPIKMELNSRQQTVILVQM